MRDLSLCMERKQAFPDYYFHILEEFRKASLRYLRGNKTVTFPEGTCATPCALLTPG
ncbi:MAG TPA: hypothetical protein PKA63_12375 [Oligoflexia bacterium]|nr:hypothetical protein [Oligoflexia bacterium]HMP49452.1 hypothetical protein [Oligoflexia bacterium]